MTIQELQAYLDPRLKSLEKAIFDNIKPIIKDVDRLRDDISDLYQKDRDTNKAIGDVAADVNTLKDDKADKKHNTGAIIAVAVALVSTIVAVVGWLR